MNISSDDIATAASYLVAAVIIGSLIYFTPFLVIGMLIGYSIGSNKDKISDWMNDEAIIDETEETDKTESNNTNEDDKH